jgi:hypothetical protein
LSTPFCSELIAFKTKETTWVIGILTLHLAFSVEDKLDIKVFYQRFKTLFLGIIGGVILFVILNNSFLGDPFFDFRLVNLQEYFSFWIQDAQYYNGAADWYRNGYFISAPLIFFLFLQRGLKLKRPEHKFIWLYPIVLIFFLTVGMVKSTYDIYLRFLYPAIAIMSVFAAQSFEFEYPNKRIPQIRFWVSFLGGIVIYQTLQMFFVSYIDSIGKDFADFVQSVVQPIAFSGILICFVFIKKFTYKSVIFPIILTIAFIRPNITENIRQAKWQPIDGVVQTRFYPLEIYSEKIEISSDMQVYVSINVTEELGFLSYDIDTLRTLFDLHFLATTSRENYTVIQNLSELKDINIVDQNLYIFVTSGGVALFL